MESGWTAATRELEQWLDSNRPALDLYREGSACPEAVYHQPRDVNVLTAVTITHNLREFALMAQLQALRQAAAGDHSGAWDWYRAMLRSSRHAGMHGCIVERLVGCTIHAMASHGIADWAAHPGVDEAQLRTALEEVRSIDAMTALPSTSLKVDYLATMKSLAHPELLQGLVEESPLDQLLPMQPLNFVMGEPDRSRRLIRQLFAELLSVCDLPRNERLQGGKGGKLIRAELVQEIYRAPLASRILPGIEWFADAMDRERARQLLLKTALRLQIFHRRNGAFPQTLEQLAADGLGEIPIDPFGKAAPIRFRLEKDPAPGVIIWSIDADGIDHKGQVKSEGVTVGDIVIHVKPPSATANGP